MYKLHYYPTNASMAPHMLLRELGSPFELILVDRARDEQRSAAYLALNPNGRIPTLVAGDLVLFESAAIMLYLGDEHPHLSWSPPLRTPARAHFYKWLIYLTNTVQADLMAWFYPERYTTDAHGTESVKEAAATRIAGELAILEQALQQGGPYLLGETCTSVDLYLYMLVRWSRFQPKPGRDYPSLRRHADLVLARPRVQDALAYEEIVEFY